MYRVYCDGKLLYHSNLESLKIFSASLDLELNKTGSFTFTIQQDHPRYDLIRKLKSIITVYQDDYLLFRGRPLDDPMRWHNEKKVACEGELAFLLDSQQRPYSYTGTIKGFLNLLIDRHNAQVEESKRFIVGNVTVVDLNDYIVRSNIDYVDTWTEIEDKLIKLLGGYIIVRHEGQNHYIDYLQDVTLLSPQKIEFGKNLLDLERIRKGASIGTALIPLGAKIKDEEGKDTDQRLTIASVNGGSDMIRDEAAISQYGTIVKKVEFDDITEPANLLTKGKAYLADLVKLPETIELTAADLATTGQDIESFHLGTYVQAISWPHGINQRFLVSKLSLNLLSPASNKMTLGGVVETFTRQVSKPIPLAGKDGRDGQDGVTLRIDSSRGTVFKNSEVSTTLHVVIFKGGKTITDAAAMRAEFGTAAHLEWGWQRIGENTFGTILTTDERLSDEGFSLLLTPGDVNTKVVFKCQLVTA